jgi:hypothetical protein
MDRIEHAAHRRHHIPIRKAEDAITFCGQELVARDVVSQPGRESVLIAIDFDDEHGSHAAEVRDVRSDNELSPEVVAGGVNLFPQCTPKRSLGFGRVISKLTRKRPLIGRDALKPWLARRHRQNAIRIVDF